MSPLTPKISRSNFDPPADNWQPGFSELGLPLKDVTFIVLDLETTGASPAQGCAITEIGAVAVRGGEILAEFSTFVNPVVPLPEYIINLTGITDEMLRDAVVFSGDVDLREDPRCIGDGERPVNQRDPA